MRDCNNLAESSYEESKQVVIIYLPEVTDRQHGVARYSEIYSTVQPWQRHSCCLSLAGVDCQTRRRSQTYCTTRQRHLPDNNLFSSVQFSLLIPCRS